MAPDNGVMHTFRAESRAGDGRPGPQLMHTHPPASPQSSPFSGWIGVAQVDVTPPVGIYARHWGAATHETATGVHRPFAATILTFQKDPNGEPLVLIGLDGPWWQDADDEWKLRGPLLEQLGLHQQQLLINLSHTHAGASFCRADGDKEGGHLIAPYLDSLLSSLAGAVRRALESSIPSLLRWGRGWCDLAQNRDLPDPDAAPNAPRRVVGWNPGATADATMMVGRVTNPGGEVRAVLVNYACHPTTLAWQNQLLSPDWVGAMRTIVEGETLAPCLFLQGASGELAPSEQYVGDVKVADRHGRQLGFAVLSVLGGMPGGGQTLVYRGIQESGAPLACWQVEEQCPSPHLSARLTHVELEMKELPNMASLLAQAQACSDPVLAERLRRQARLRRGFGVGSSWQMPLWCWRLGEAILVAQPAEAYSLLQTQLRSNLAPRPIIVLNLCNGSPGYLPPAEMYQENVYAAWQSPFAAGGLERLLDAALDQATGLLSPTT